MIDFNDAKSQLKTYYIEQGFNLVDEHQRELYFAGGQSSKVRFVIREDEITEYAEVAEILPTLKSAPVETSIVGPDFREQLVDYVAGGRRPLIWRQPAFRFGELDGELPYVEVGPLSPVYLNYLRFRKEGMQLFRERFDRVYPSSGSDTLREVLSRTNTIKVRRLHDAPSNISESTSLFEHCLFELSYLRNVHLELRASWAFSRDRRRPFSFGRRVGGRP